ncbi:MAG: GNAT family N-acetyltransferase [Thermoleophilia bacterium]|nr:GNAT family N-acetyltransferase [Thermoleophilia bacterium]
MTVRRASRGDLPVLRELLTEFEAEVPEPPHREGGLDRELEEIPDYLERGLALVAEVDGEPAGYALARLEPPRICYLSDIYVRPFARRRGLAKALLAGVVDWARAGGAEHMTLEVLTTNVDARAVYRRLGFGEESLNLVCALDELRPRLEPGARGESLGSIHVQTDDADAVARAVARFVPRLPGGSRGSAVAPPRNGWTAVYDELCDREPAMLRRLALELSDRMGAVVLAIGIEEGEAVRYVLFERGSVVDEYLSVPEYHGPLPPGDVIALGANPTVLARLTGADPARVRETARTAASPAELPPAPELLARLAALLGVEGAAHGYAGARELAGAILLDR